MNKNITFIGGLIIAFTLTWISAWLPITFFFTWILEISFGLELKISFLMLSFILNCISWVYKLIAKPKYFIKAYKDVTNKTND